MRTNWILVSLLLIASIGSCARPNPIDTSSPVDFQHRSTVFTMQVPSNWTQLQDQVETEALGIFTDPTGQASIIAYVGLLDRRLDDEEGLKIAGDLASTLLSNPDDYQVIDRQHQPDGVFEVTFAFKRGELKHSGRATFHDTDLALSGVIVSGPEQGWADLQNALAPYVDSFEIDPIVLQASYFAPLEDTYYILVVPADWSNRRGADGIEVQSRNRRMSILLVQHDLGQSIEAAALADQAAASLRRSFRVTAKVVGSEPLDDGRLKVTLDQGDRRIVGYIEQFDTVFVGLFFQVPADRVEDYQPFIDFVYSTYISGLP
ncbi:MAG: hypothetical protein ACRDGG_01685 [Anaerolineae bacterium]